MLDSLKQAGKNIGRELSRTWESLSPGTQPDAVLRLKGKDLPEFGNGRHGELYLRIEVHVPEKLSGEERELYERLRAIGGKPAGFFSKMWK